MNQQSLVCLVMGALSYTLAGTDALKLFGRPMTRVQNYCASGMDAFRNACLTLEIDVHARLLAVVAERDVAETTHRQPDHEDHEGRGEGCQGRCQAEEVADRGGREARGLVERTYP